MKIGYDGKRAIENATGLGNYSRLLVEVMSERFPENDYLLYAPRLKYNPRMLTLLERENVSLSIPSRGGATWRSYGVTGRLIADNIRLYHGLSGELPVNIDRFDGAKVVTIHDLIFRRYPSGYNAIDRWIYDYKSRRACLAADRIIAVSNRTKLDIMEYYGIPEDRIDVVYQGCDEQFHRSPSTEEIEAVKKKYGIKFPYVITVGTVETRKNQMMAVRGIRGVHSELGLVIVGHRTEYAKTLDKYIRTFHLEDRVKFLEHVDFNDLPALYAGAFCSSYTSRYEGFGIPVIESLSVGTPVIVASGSCLKEAGGPSIPSVDPDDIEQWVSIVVEMANYPEERENIIEKGRAYIEQFSASAMAEATMASYRRALEQRGLL